MNNTLFKVSALAAALSAAFAPALAAANEEIDALTKPESSVSAGVGTWLENRRQLGIYDGQRDNRMFGILDLNLVKRSDDGTWLRLDTLNLNNHNTREVRAEWLKQGSIGFTVEHNRTSRDNPLTFNTGLQGIGTANMTISGAPALGQAFPFRDVTLGTQREANSISYYQNFADGLDSRITFKHEHKDGSRQWGLGSAAAFLVEPISSDTKQFEAVLNFSGKDFQVSGGYNGSWYENDYKTILGTINGLPTAGSTGSPRTTPLSQPLDNQAHQLFVEAGYSFTPSTRGTVKASYTVATQDEVLPTFAAPSAPSALAPDTLDAEVQTTNLQLGLTSRPMKDLSLLGSVRYYDVNDKTPLAAFVDSAGVATVHDTPHSFTTTSGKLEANYALGMGYSVLGGVDYSNQDRSFPADNDERFVPFRTELEETTYRLQLRKSFSEILNGSLAYMQSRRKGSAFTGTGEAESDEINPIHIADRDREKVRVALDLSPTEQLSLQLVVESSQDEYGNSAARPFGLRDGEASLYALDATFALNDDWKFGAWVAQDDTKATQFGQRAAQNASGSVFQALAAAEKVANLRDRGEAVGFTVLGKVHAKVKGGAEVQWTRNVSEHHETVTTTGAGATFPTQNIGTAGTPRAGATTPGNLPDIESVTTRIRLFAEYALEKSSDLRFDFIHELWKTNDWSYKFADGSAFTYTQGCRTTGVLCDNIDNWRDLTTVHSNQRERSDFFGVTYRYRFQ